MRTLASHYPLPCVVAPEPFNFGRNATQLTRAGLTLIEMMIAMLIFVGVFGIAVPFFRMQVGSLGGSAGRSDALQAARYGQDAVDRDLRIAGAGVVPAQPLLVQADPYAVTFNVDLVSNDTLDMNAIYYDPAASAASTIAMSVDDARQLPLSGEVYPKMDYLNESAPSSAETVSYWVEPDTAPDRGGWSVLYRSVNGGAKRVVSTGLFVEPGVPVFTYQRLDSSGKLVDVTASDLPLFHSVAVHGGPGDENEAAWIDSIRVVGVRLTGKFTDRDGKNLTRTVESATRLLNAGMIRNAVCGETPLSPESPGATYDASAGAVTISWAASGDQDAAEKDVARYIVYKQYVGASAWGAPIGSVAASGTSYDFPDSNLEPGDWRYGITAQDCTPMDSPMAVTPAVSIPTP